MNEALKKSLERLHIKQDHQTEKISALEITVAKQEVSMDSYMRQSDRMASELQKLNENMAVYNAELKVHIAGVVELKEMNRLMREENRLQAALLDERLKVAELPIGWLRTAGKILKWAAPIAAAGAGVAGLILKLMGKL